MIPINQISNDHITTEATIRTIIKTAIEEIISETITKTAERTTEDTETLEEIIGDTNNNKIHLHFLVKTQIQSVATPATKQDN